MSLQMVLEKNAGITAKMIKTNAKGRFMWEGLNGLFYAKRYHIGTPM